MGRKLNGKEIQERLDNGWEVVVYYRTKYYRNSDRITKGLVYEIRSKEDQDGNYSMQPSTKFRVLRHLTESQKANIERFETVLRLLKADVQFNQRLENHKELNRLIENEDKPYYFTAKQAITENQYTFL